MGSGFPHVEDWLQWATLAKAPADRPQKKEGDNARRAEHQRPIIGAPQLSSYLFQIDKKEEDGDAERGDEHTQPELESAAAGHG